MSLLISVDQGHIEITSIQWFDGLDHVHQIFSENISHSQPVPPCLDPVSPSTDLDHPILTQYHPVTTSAAPYQPSTIKVQSVPPNTNPSPPSINKKCPLLTQCHQIQTSIWENINLQIFSQLDVISIHIRGRVWPGLPVIFECCQLSNTIMMLTLSSYTKLCQHRHG